MSKSRTNLGRFYNKPVVEPCIRTEFRTNASVCKVCGQCYLSAAFPRKGIPSVPGAGGRIGDETPPPPTTEEPEAPPLDGAPACESRAGDIADGDMDLGGGCRCDGGPLPAAGYLAGPIFQALTTGPGGLATGVRAPSISAAGDGGSGLAARLSENILNTLFCPGHGPGLGPGPPPKLQRCPRVGSSYWKRSTPAPPALAPPPCEAASDAPPRSDLRRIISFAV